MSIFKDLVKNLGLTNITQSKKKYVTVSENNSEEEKEKAKYKVKNIDNLKSILLIFNACSKIFSTFLLRIFIFYIMILFKKY